MCAIISNIPSENTEIDVQKLAVFKKVLEAGSNNIKRVLESMMRCGVDNRAMRVEITDTYEVRNMLASSSSHHVVVSSGLDGDMVGKVVLVMRGRDFKAVCELLSKAHPYAVLPGVSLEILQKMIPDWVRMNSPSSSDSFKIREMMFDAAAELANMVFSGYLGAVYSFLGLTTFHSPPQTSVGLKKLDLEYRLRPTSSKRQICLCTENHFVAWPCAFKIWFLLMPSEMTFKEALNRIEVVESS
ncbi:MAG: hypothetical protein OQJ84_08835 [Xanthomonadales bacterium]|nr:hypothetical protein [Xanthomonadales bacterium]